MVTVIPATLSESVLVRNVRAGIEHGGVGAIVGNAVAFQIDDVPGQRCRLKAAAGGPYHAGLGHHPTGAGMARQGERGTAPAAKARAMRMASLAAEAIAYMPRLPGGPHDLSDEGVGLAAAAAAISNAPEPDAEVVVTRAQGCSPLRRDGDGAQRVEMVGILIGTAGRGVRQDGERAQSDQPLAPGR